MASTMTGLLVMVMTIGISIGQNCNYVIPSEYDTAYAVDICRTFVDPTANLTTYKQFVCVMNSTGSWNIEEQIHSSSDCDDNVPTQTTIISSPYDYNCDAIGQCEYVLITQYEEGTFCSTSGVYSVDAIVTNVCINQINDDDFFSAYGTHRYFCQNNSANWRVCEISSV